MTNNTLRISEIFYSLQGEALTMGVPTIFIRLTGCPLRCAWCDTPYAFKGGKLLTLDDICLEVNKYKAKHITISGGEPLAQPNCLPLMTNLLDKGYTVSIETSGALDIKNIDKRVVIVMDLKAPDSYEESKNLYANLDYLKPSDQIKIVIASRADYEWAKAKISSYKLDSICEVLLSPSFHDIKPRILADWILEDELNVRFQFQLHKLLWNDEPGR